MSVLDEAAFAGEVPVGALVSAALAHHAAARRIALETDRETLTYADLADRVNAAASRLVENGTSRGARLAIAGHRGAEAVILFLAALESGVTASIFDPETPSSTLYRQLSELGVRGVPLTLDELRGSHGSGARLPTLRSGDPAMIQLTSGSTGSPKGVLLSQGNLACNVAGIIERTGLSPEDRLLHVMPLHHTNGINNQIVAPLLAGSTIVLQPRFKAEWAVQALQERAITIMTGVPTIFARMLPQITGGETFRSLRFLRCGSAPLDESLHRHIEAAFGVPLVVSYGLSEATCTSVMNAPADRRIGSVGTALRGQRIGIFRPGTDTLLASNEEGEIRITGPALMRCYIGSDQTPIRNGWLETGDLGVLERDGSLRITGRLKDIIIRGGENISPSEIEAAALELAEVHSCCAIGAPHPELGEVPVLFVVAAPDMPMDPDRVRKHVRDRLSRIHEPAWVIPVARLPENSVGKVDRKSLAARLPRPIGV